MLIRNEGASTSIQLLQEVDVVFFLCCHGGCRLLDILPLEVTKDPMGCGVAPAWPFDSFCIEPLCGPYASEVDARYQHIEGLHVQLQVPVMLSICLFWILHLAVLCTWDLTTSQNSSILV